jgi:hypothetical protein
MNPPEIIDELAARKAGGAVSLLLTWKQALAVLPPLPGATLRTIALACPSPGAARQLGRFLAREGDPQGAVEELLRAVDESDETLESWLGALRAFAGYLDGTPQRPPLRKALGYLHCCQAMVQSGPRYETFPMAVETLLATHGFEGDADPAG